MELLYLLAPLISCLLCIIFASYLYFKPKSREVAMNLPPGTRGWPIIGETIEYANSQLKGTTEKFFEDRFQKYSMKIFKTSLLREPFVVLHGAAGNKFIFSSHDKLLERWWPKSVGRITSSIIGSSLEESSEKVRKQFMKSISAEPLQMFTGIVDMEAKKHFDTNWHNREEVFALPLVKQYITSLGCRVFMNVTDPSEAKEFGQLVGDITAGMASVPINIPGGKFNRAMKSMDRLLNKLAAVVKQRKIDLFVKKCSKPTILQDDVLSRLLLSSDDDQDGESLDEIEIAKQLVPMFLGAGDSSSTTISHVLMFLAENPHVYEKVFEEQIEITKSKAPGELLSRKDIWKMKYLWNVICETLRYISPASGFFRMVASDINYEGFTIPKGWKIHWSAKWTHMNPDYYPEPKKFDPSRFEGNGPAPYTFIPFGGGSRLCPGKDYARLALLIFLHNALITYKWEKVIPDENTTIVAGVPMPAKGLHLRLSKLS